MEEVCPTHRDPNTSLWMVTMAPLILGMNAAFGLLEAGSVQNKNVLNIMMKNLGDLVLGGVAWYVIGYRIAFTHESSKWPQFVADESMWVFQWSFAATAATIDSGALAERVNFLSYCLLSFVMTAFIYPLVVSWVWNPEGFLAQMGFVDFAGSAVVHMVGGVSALVSTAMLGPRIGRFSRYKPSNSALARCLLRRPMNADYYAPIPGRPPISPITDAVSAVWGVFFLWIGWYGFNPGGVVDVETYKGAFSVGRIAVNTTMGAIGGGMVGFLRRAIFPPHHVVPEDLCQGVLAGLVAVTAGCLNLDSGTSFAMGCVAACLAFLVKYGLERAYIDDVVAAIPVHGACGFFGTVMVGFFAVPNSCSGGPTGVVFAKGGAESREAWRFAGVQLFGCVVIALWSAASTFVFVTFMNQFELLRFRLPRHIEVLGIDEHEHDMPKQLEDFLEVLKHLVQALSQPSPSAESVREAAILASQRITFPTVMSHFRREQLKKMKGLSLRVSDIKLTGLEPGCAVYCSSQVVMLDAEPQDEDQKGAPRKHVFEYYAPRWTQPSQGPVAVWSDTLEFPDFYVPPLTEDSMCVTFHITKAAKDSKKFVLGTVQVPFKSLPWVHEADGDSGHLQALVDAPLFVAAVGNGIAAGARLTASISMSTHRPQNEGSVPMPPKRASTVMRLMAGSTTSSEHKSGRGERDDSTDRELTTQTFASLRQQFMGEAAQQGAAGAAPFPSATTGTGDLARQAAELTRQLAELSQQVASFTGQQPEPGPRQEYGTAVVI